MPLPQHQLKQLKGDLQNHDKELKELETGGHSNQPDVRKRIKLHKLILKIGRDRKILEAVEELFDKPELAAELASDPDAFIAARAIQLPSDATGIVVLRQAPEPVAAGVEFRIEDIAFRLEWRADSGFRIEQIASPQ